MGFSLGIEMGLRNRCLLTAAISAIFAGGTQGVWFDPSDMSTLFQDSAGTTPVTSVEQPVGRMLDKSGNGNHATQATAGARPVLCARLNQLTKSDQLDDAAWGKTACTVTANVSGTLDKIVEDLTTGTHRITGPGITASVGMAFVQSFRVAPSGRNHCLLTFSNTTPWTGGVAPTATFNLLTGTVTASSGGTAAITNLGDGTFRITFAIVCAGTGNFAARLALHNGSSSSYAGDGASGILAGQAQLELGTAFTRYQSIDTSTVYDSAGFNLYLRHDAAGMWMSFTLPGVFTAATAFHAYMSEQAAGSVVYGVNNVNATTNVGFGVAMNTAVDSRTISGNGTSLDTAASAAVTIMPHVATASSNGATLRSRVNMSNAATQASATNFGGTTWRIGRTLTDTGGITGRTYGLVLVGKILTSGQETDTIRSLASKFGTAL